MSEPPSPSGPNAAPLIPPTDPATAEAQQLAYLKRLLEGTEDPAGPGEFLYLSRSASDTWFWELVGFRVSGLPYAVVGALRFQAQSRDRSTFARRPLGQFLSSPPQNLALDRTKYPADLVEVRVPRLGESLPDLLGRLKRDERAGTLYLDVEKIEVAFDFRSENPSLERPRQTGAPGQRLVVRSQDGHVLSGVATHLSARLHSQQQFVTLTGVEQWLPEGSRRLPTLVLHRRSLTMLAEADEGEADASLPHPFDRRSANPSHVLDPRLGAGG